MITAALDIAVNALALVLFCQSLWTTGLLAIGRQPLVPPVAPDDDQQRGLAQPNTSQKTLSTEHVLSEAQLAIAKAVHPHLHGLNRRAEPETAAIQPDLAESDCGQVCSNALRNNRIYQRLVPYASVNLAALQSVLGVCMTVATLVWQVAGLDDCRALTTLSLTMFHVGFALLMLASALQTHTTNAMCIKIFFIMAVGLGVHFAMFGLTLTHHTASFQLDASSQTICVVDILQPRSWLGRLPLITGVAHFLVCFFSTISFINAAFRLCPHARFLAPRDIVAVFLVFRGLGTMFANAVFGVLASTLTSFLAAFSVFHFSPYWPLQWAIMSRILAAALWHRTHTDPQAHTHWFWTSSTYYALCSRQVPLANAAEFTWNQAPEARPGLLRVIGEITRAPGLSLVKLEPSASASSLGSLLSVGDAAVAIGPPPIRNIIVYVEYDSSNNAKTMVEDYDNFVAFKGQYYMYDDLLNDPDFRTEQDMQVVVLIGLKCKITYDDPLNATPADSWFTEISPEDT
ncbi:hypothetical protein LPJ63_004340, partial [Coemansia sp. RSA 2711]